MSAAPTEVGGGVSQTTEALQAKLEETKISEEKPVTAEQDDQDDQDDDEAVSYTHLTLPTICSV